MTPARWLDVPIRVLISIALLYCIYLVSARAIAQWYFRQPPPEGLRKAIEWDPANPMYHSALARVLSSSLEGADLNEVIHLYEKSTELSPYQARYWAELGGAYEVAGQVEDAQRAYERAQQLFPNSPEINWQLGNFYLRQGSIRLALKAFQKVLLGDSSLWRQAFDLAWRAGAEPELILAEMIPPQPDILFPYLNYLIEKQRIDQADEVWARILALQLPFEANAAFPYLDALISNKRVNELTTAWATLTKLNPTRIRQRAFDPNLITNGDFESEILNGGLDWRVGILEGVVVSVDSLTFFDGTHSLKIQFDGTHNLDYGHVYQYIPVKPKTLYRFTGYMRTQGITTDSGLQFQVYNAYDSSKLSLSTENLVGTSSWSPQQLEFQTGPDTQLLVVRVARSASRKFDNQIAGTLWVDRMSLNAVE